MLRVTWYMLHVTCYMFHVNITCYILHIIDVEAWTANFKSRASSLRRACASIHRACLLPFRSIPRLRWRCLRNVAENGELPDKIERFVTFVSSKHKFNIVILWLSVNVCLSTVFIGTGAVNRPSCPGNLTAVWLSQCICDLIDSPGMIRGRV